MSAGAVIKDGEIVIRLNIDAMPAVVEQIWTCGRYGWSRQKVTDKAAFAKAFVAELNREEEDGTTPLHLLFDKAAMTAIENGAEGVEEHEDQDE